MSDLWDQRYTKDDARIVKRIAWSVVGHFGYRVTDVEDVEQDIAMHVMQKTRVFNPKHGHRKAFITTVAKNKLLHLIEQRTAQKRDCRRNVSMDRAGEGVLVDGTVSVSRLHLQMDVRQAIERLPDDLRRLAELRMHHSERDLEPLLGLSRGQVRSLIRKIERLFREWGLAPASMANRQPAPRSGT